MLFSRECFSGMSAFLANPAAIAKKDAGFGRKITSTRFARNPDLRLTNLLGAQCELLVACEVYNFITQEYSRVHGNP